MQEAVPEGVGAMAAVLGLDDDKIISICSEAADTQVVSAANFNTDGQVVIAGHREAVERAITMARDAGAKRAMLLAVSVPSHCNLMQEAAEKVAQRIDDVTFSDARIPIVQNVDAQLRSDAADLKQALLQQLHQPVLWWKSVNKMKEMGIVQLIECGPGKVLAGLVKRIDRDLQIQSVNDVDTLQASLNRGDS